MNIVDMNGQLRIRCFCIPAEGADHGRVVSIANVNGILRWLSAEFNVCNLGGESINLFTQADHKLHHCAFGITPSKEANGLGTFGDWQSFFTVFSPIVCWILPEHTCLTGWSCVVFKSMTLTDRIGMGSGGTGLRCREISCFWVFAVTHITRWHIPVINGHR